MATQIKITQLTDIGSANIAGTTLLPVVNMAGVPTTQKTTLGNLANVILSQAGGNYAAAAIANLSYNVINANQPNITGLGTLTNLTVSGNVAINGNISSNGTAYLGNISTTGLASITTLSVGAIANLGAVGNVKIAGGSVGEILSTDGLGNLSWVPAAGNSTYGNSNVVTLLNNFGSNTITTTGNITANYFVGVATNVTVEAVDNNFSYHMAFVTGNGDTTLHMDADSDLQYNPNDGTMTVVRLDADYVLTNNLWYSNGLPYSIPTVGDITFSNSNISTSVANANLRLNGNGTSGNVVISSNTHNWIFDFNGTFTTPGSLLPNANITYDLGSSVQRWRDLWIANSTIHLGDLALSTSNTGELSTSQLIAGGEGIGGIAYIEWTTDSELSIRTNDVSPFIATFESLKINDSFLLIDGGNGAFPANTNVVVSGAVTQTTPVSGYIDFIIPVDDAPGSNVYVYMFNLTRAPITEFSQLTGNTITLGNAVLTANGNALVVSSIEVTDGNVGTIGNIAAINLDGSNSNVLYGNGVFAPVTGGGGLPLANGNSNINIATANGPITLSSAGQTWTIGTDGSLTAPNNSNIYPAGNNFNAFAPAAGSMQFYSDGGNFAWSLDGYGVMNLPFASALSNTSIVYSGGNFRIDAGANNFVFTDDGNLSLSGGGSLYGLPSTPSGAPGNTIVLQPVGPGYTTNQKLMVYPTAGDGDHIHMTTGNLYQTELFLGSDNFFVKLSNTGNVVVNTDDTLGNTGTWTFTSDGNLVLAGGNSVIKSIANSSLDPLNPNVSTMTLTPDANYSSQVLVLDPTAPGHIHLRALSFGNIDDPAANIFLGGEATSFEITYGSNNEARVHSNNHTWTFGNDGTLLLPRDASGNTDPYLWITGGNAPSISSVDVSLAGPANFQIVSDYLNLSGYSGAKVAIKADNGEIATDANMVLTTNGANVGNTYSWTFDTDGNLTLPGAINVGNMVIGTVPGDITADANTGVTFNVSGPDGGFAVNYLDEVGNANTSGGELAFSSETGNATYRISLSDDLGDGFATKIWRFDGTGNLTLPGNTFAVNYANGTQASAPLVDVLNTNGLTTVFYPTFVENRTDGQIVRADVDLSYRSDTNTLTVGNITGNTNGYTLGYLNIPQVAASNTTLALTDAGKHYYSTTAGNLTLTIPNNATTSFETGTAISIVVQAAGNVLVNAAAGVTLYMAGNSTSANRVVGTFGMATLMKVATDTWFINGTGVS